MSGRQCGNVQFVAPGERGWYDVYCHTEASDKLYTE
jgi:hypothetical protein